MNFVSPHEFRNNVRRQKFPCGILKWLSWNPLCKPNIKLRKLVITFYFKNFISSNIEIFNPKIFHFYPVYFRNNLLLLKRSYQWRTTMSHAVFQVLFITVDTFVWKVISCKNAYHTLNSLINSIDTATLVLTTISYSKSLKYIYIRMQRL